MLIDPAHLRRLLQTSDVVIFDCRHDLSDAGFGRRAYDAGHLPGARFAAVDGVLSGEKTGRNGRHPLPDAVEFAAFLNEHGVTPDTHLVAYDQANGAYAARLWWMTRWIGLTRAVVLDGGFARWVASGGAVTTEPAPARLRGRIVAKPQPQLLRTAAEVLAATRDGRHVVLDARSPDRFRGEVEPIDRVAGHIPGALNRPYTANLTPECTMRPAEELRREFTTLLGSWRPEQIVHQCGSGITACVNLLAMEHAGLTGSKLYAGSWSEWSSDPSRPVARGG